MGEDLDTAYAQKIETLTVPGTLCFSVKYFYVSQKNSVEAISLLVQDYHSRSAIREMNGEYQWTVIML